MAFQGMNPEIERMMEEAKWQAVQERFRQHDLSKPFLKKQGKASTKAPE